MSASSRDKDGKLSTRNRRSDFGDNVQDDGRSCLTSFPHPMRMPRTRKSLLANGATTDSSTGSTTCLTPTVAGKLQRPVRSQWCSALNCKNSRTKNKMSFFRFPVDEARSKQWVMSCRRTDLLKKTGKELNISNVLCQQHFELDQFNNVKRNRLLRDAVPTLFDFGSGLPKPTSPISTAPKRPPVNRGSTDESTVKKSKKGGSSDTGLDVLSTLDQKGPAKKSTGTGSLSKTGKWYAKHGPGLSKEQIDTNFHSPKDIEKEYLFSCLHSALASRFGKASEGKGKRGLVSDTEDDNTTSKSASSNGCSKRRAVKMETLNALSSKIKNSDKMQTDASSDYEF